MSPYKVRPPNQNILIEKTYSLGNENIGIQKILSSLEIHIPEPTPVYESL